MTFSAPDELRARVPGSNWSPAWDGPDGTTWRIEHADGAAWRFLKVRRRGVHPTTVDEAARLRWARKYLPVPNVLEAGHDDDVEWLLTDALDGVDATRHPLRDDDPEVLVTALGYALRLFHERAPVASCPFDFRLGTALDHVRARVAAGLVDAERDFQDEFTHLSIEEAVEELERLTPAHEDAIVCHGDPCFPNFLLDEAGVVTGYVDLGELGVADRAFDLAVGSWSCDWNVGPGFEGAFYDAYGETPDADRVRFYRLLYMLAS